jgi:hypothetical protein
MTCLAYLGIAINRFDGLCKLMEEQGYKVTTDCQFNAAREFLASKMTPHFQEPTNIVKFPPK